MIDLWLTCLPFGLLVSAKAFSRAAYLSIRLTRLDCSQNGRRTIGTKQSSKPHLAIFGCCALQSHLFIIYHLLCEANNIGHNQQKMAAQAEGRILKELAEVQKNDTSGVSASVVPGTGGNRHLLGKIKGPEGTVYDGGVFEIDIVIPAPYPFEPPKMKFVTKIWHPNISSQTGVS